MAEIDAIKETLSLYRLLMSGIFGSMLVVLLYNYQTLESPPTINWFHFLAIALVSMFVVCFAAYRKDVKKLEQM